MKTKFVKKMMPVFAFVLAIAASLTIHAQNVSNTTTMVNGYLQNAGNPQSCTDSGISCTTLDTGIICKSNGVNLHEFDSGSTSCFPLVYKPQP